MDNSFSIWQKQKEYLDQEKINHPELFQRADLLDTPQVLKMIGIDYFSPNRPAAYLKFWPQDFIVEEISKDGQIHTVDCENQKLENNPQGLTTYTDLVKVGMSTLDVVDELSKSFGIDKRLIGYAGIKDRDAITSQFVCFRNTPAEKIKEISSPNFFFKNIYQDRGAIQIGDLLSNKFTIVVRSNTNLEQNVLFSEMKKLETEGFWNFYYTQRFGTPRLISHYLGLLILQAQYEEVLKTLMTFIAPTEVKYFQNLRQQILGQWKNWQKIYGILAPVGYSFRRELIILKHLIKYPTDYLGALKLFSDQVQLWIFAYGSYLFNRKLSQLIKMGEVPLELPLVFSFNPSDWAVYKDLLAADRLRMSSEMFRDFTSIQIKNRFVQTSQNFKFNNLIAPRDNPKTAIASFTLPKGSYATTLLAHLFTLSGGMPILEGIDTAAVDAKQILGIGNMQSTIDLFKDVIVSKLEGETKEEMEI